MTNGKPRQFIPLGLLLVILAAGALTGCATPLQLPPPGPKIRVYVADITQNNVLAYIMNDFVTGTLTPAGSPIAANCNGPAAFAKAPSGKFAYVMCAHSNQFSGFAIDQATNGLTPAGTFTTGNNPVAAAIDPGSRFLYVANGGSNSVTGFSIDSATGTATAIAGATVTTNFAPNGLAIDPLAGFLYVSTLTGNGGDLEGFSIDAVTGALTPLAGSPFASFLATGLQVHPLGKYIYVSDEVNGIRAFSINGMGALVEIAGSPFAAGNEPFGVSVDPEGKHLYAANFVSHDISGYTIDPNTGKLTPVPGSPIAVGVAPARAVVDTFGVYLYVPDSNDNTLRAYSINQNGSLSAVSGSPFAATGAEDVMTIP
ncbi:MAG TPA: beta-propeller fold lactonase family protein [Candidatus Angelobacter sp.]|nr:beta-propeller fold lactonase family protein [Candidatus Angelobacter sp.]